MSPELKDQAVSRGGEGVGGGLGGSPDDHLQDMLRQLQMLQI